MRRSLLVDLDLARQVLEEGDRLDRGEGGVAAGLGVEGRDAHQAVDALLHAHQPVASAPGARPGR